MDSPEKPAVSSTTPNHSGFYSQKLWGFFLFSAETLGYAVCPVAVITGSQGFPPNFYPPHLYVGPPTPLPLPPLHATLCVLISVPPNHLDDCGLFKSLVVGLSYSLIFWQFSLLFNLRLFVIIFVVVRGGEVCLPTPPSSVEVRIRSYLSKLFYYKVLKWIYSYLMYNTNECIYVFVCMYIQVCVLFFFLWT